MTTRQPTKTKRRSTPKATHLSNGRAATARTRSPRRQSSEATMMLDGVADRLMNRIKDFGNEAVHTADTHVRDIRDSAKTYMKAGRKRAVKMERALEHRVEERPIASLLIVSVIDLILGMFFWRR